MTEIRVERADWVERDVVMRLPFQFGAVTMQRTGEAHCRITAAIDGREVEGRSAQLMVPRWFDKRPELSAEDTIDELRVSVRAACEASIGMRGPLVAVARDLRVEAAARMPAATPRLAAGFGAALVEMALIDAVCRAKGLPFWRAAQGDVFGLAAHCPEDLAADALEKSLARITPPHRVCLRHTIGFDAPLTVDEIGADAPQDDLPVSLDQVIGTYGIRAFKIKLKGDPEADLARLGAIAPVIAPAIAGTAERSVTLDANEQYAVDSFTAFWEGFSSARELAPIRDALRFVEQPFDRAEALSAPVSEKITVPLVIDESDDHDDAFAEALALGWQGTSIKSCKGVLRALLNRARADVGGALLSGEDLTCQPGLCWQQDTAMAAACGVQDIERNGHHFAGGMQGATDAEVLERLSVHHDIYRQTEGRPALRIENGEVAVGSLDRPGFGGV